MPRQQNARHPFDFTLDENIRRYSERSNHLWFIRSLSDTTAHVSSHLPSFLGVPREYLGGRDPILRLYLYKVRRYAQFVRSALQTSSLKLETQFQIFRKVRKDNDQRGSELVLKTPPYLCGNCHIANSSININRKWFTVSLASPVCKPNLLCWWQGLVLSIKNGFNKEMEGCCSRNAQTF